MLASHPVQKQTSPNTTVRTLIFTIDPPLQKVNCILSVALFRADYDLAEKLATA